MALQKKLSDKQYKAIEMLTCGKGIHYKDIAKELNIDVKTLYMWRNHPDYTLFQQEIDRVNEERWMATVDLAREQAQQLIKKGNQKMVEFALKTAGLNPTQKVEAEVNTDINITVE